MLFKCDKFIVFCVLACMCLFFIYARLPEDKGLSDLSKQNNIRKGNIYENKTDHSECKLSFGQYTGPLWTKMSETVGRSCLLESKRMRVDHHIRQLPDGSKIDDWLWIDYGDRVNVLVREKPKNGRSGDFLLFEQTKYALHGSSLAVVGGFIEPSETPEAAALREVREELQLDCDIAHLKSLGKYRTDVNRGLGWVNGFLAQDCVPTESSSKKKDDVVDADNKQEDQSLRRLSMDELEVAVRAGRFIEVQWTAAVALALLHLKDSDAK